MQGQVSRGDLPSQNPAAVQTWNPKSANDARLARQHKETLVPPCHPAAGVALRLHWALRRKGSCFRENTCGSETASICIIKVRKFPPRLRNRGWECCVLRAGVRDRLLEPWCPCTPEGTHKYLVDREDQFPSVIYHYCVPTCNCLRVTMTH